MPNTSTVIAFLILAVSIFTTDVRAQDKQPTSAEHFRALRKEYDCVPGPAPRNDAERMVYIGKVYKHHNEVAQKFLDLALKYPNDPIAFDALSQAVWQVNTIPWPADVIGEDTARPKAFEIIVRDHIQSEKIGPLCQRVSYGFAKEYEAFLRAVVAKNTNKNVQTIARLSLGHYLHNRMQRMELCKEQPEQAKDFAGLYGREYIAELLRRKRQEELKEIESVFEQSIEKFGDVKLPEGDTVAERAKVELFEIRNLSVGREAPDIVGDDQDGKRFKLSEYRGKVVLLDFWSYV